ncbi:hypothetical protein S40288_00399 [Stachybotrys chartarum IBT 40288]|nr:hypothetical protein S40288_00399 [Stachybotrys chartarum IBT 40288]
MPPLVPRKRLRASPEPDQVETPRQGTKTQPKKPASASSKRKVTLYDALDASATPPSKQAASILESLQDGGSDSSLSSLSDSDFEDVPIAKRPRVAESSDDDDDIQFEDVAAPKTAAVEQPMPSGDLELTLNKDTRISLTNQYGDKKGPTKREKAVRNATHCIHVMSLLWHNAVRNSWLCDPEAQGIMLSHVPPKMWDEYERWRRSSGLVTPPPPKPVPQGKRKIKGKGKKTNDVEARDWGSAAERLEEGMVDMSHGDPLFRLMQCLVAWWKQRFRVRAPGLRKWGYMPLERLDRLTKAFKSEPHDQNVFGEKVDNLEAFRACAQECQGSRDVGAQLFACLLRALGLDARMVASLQCLGFGWNKLEDADPEPDESRDKTPTKDRDPPKGPKTKKANGQTSKAKPSAQPNGRRTSSSRPSRSKTQTGVADADKTDNLDLEYEDTDDESVVEVEVTPRKPQPPAQKYDQDLEYAHYWVEVLSPITKKYLPVEPVLKGIVATNRDLIESLEPRGAKADRARQTMAYVVAYSQDGTAKDVTVRYLKKQIFPGRTKGSRLAPEKVPVYNRHGKVKRYEMFDWFKTAMSGYRRGSKRHPFTEVDDEEDSTDLKPKQPEKKEIKEGEETLQYYKQSKEFVLQRHLKREEALRPGAVPVKVFKNKGKGNKTEEEDVYLRSDVLNVKSAETWHKQGRAPLPGEQPLKRVPYRAATTNRRREILEAEAATGQKVLQGLYSWEQTEWIIPPPIKDGVIPKNEYGNIDLFAEHMCPKGAVHVPFRGAIRVCKRLQIDYAEAVVDFEFGHRMAVPVIQGVVIAEEYHDQVMEELEKDEAERKRKEDEKRRKAVLGQWRRFLMGMRIVERIRQEYGEVDESVSVLAHSKATGVKPQPVHNEDEDMAGGFLPEGYEEESEDEEQPAHATSSFFPVADEDDDADDDLIMEDHRQAAAEDKEEAAAAPEAALPKKGKTKRQATPAKRAAPRRRSTRGRRRRVIDDDEDEEEDEDEWEPSDID